MTTRLALILALLLLALAAAQWHLRSISQAPPLSKPGEVSVVEVWEEVGDDGLDELEEPEIIIPEYVPTPITERPTPPMGFAVDSVQVELVAPRVGGATESELED